MAETQTAAPRTSHQRACNVTGGGAGCPHKWNGAGVYPSCLATYARKKVDSPGSALLEYQRELAARLARGAVK